MKDGWMHKAKKIQKRDSTVQLLFEELKEKMNCINYYT